MTKLRVNSVIATLGVGTIIVGLGFSYSCGVPIVAGAPEAFLRRPLGIPNPIIVMALVVGGLWVLVERTAIGQEIQAVGGNPAAARLAGISVERIKILGFMISGVCAALTGAPLATRLGSGTTSAADPYLLTALGGGHTIGQQFVLIDTAAGRRVISGDCAYSRRQFTWHANDGVYVPLNTPSAASGSSSRPSTG